MLHLLGRRIYRNAEIGNNSRVIIDIIQTSAKLCPLGGLLGCRGVPHKIYPLVCERGATTRGCSGGRGSDDTRGYGVGSGDVG